MTDAPITDAELATVDLIALLAAPLRGADGNLRGDLAGEGSVAAAIQLAAGGATAAGLAEVLGAARAGAPLEQLADAGPPEVTPLLAAVLAAGARHPDEGDAFNRWLGRVAELVALREP